MEKYVRDNINSPAFYIDIESESGLFEPVHLRQKETEILAKGMVETLTKCSDEIGFSQWKFYQITKQASLTLDEQLAKIKELIDLLVKHTKENPWIFQKCSLRGL